VRLGPLADLLAVALVTGLFWAIPVLARPTLPFGVRVPGEHAHDPAVVAQRRRYGERVLRTGAPAAVMVTALALLAVPPEVRSGVVALAGAADMAFFLVASHAVRAAKREGDWYAGVRQAVTTDTSLRTDPVRLPWAALVPAVAVLVITAVVAAVRYPDLPATLPVPRGAGIDPAVRQPTTPAVAFALVIEQAVVTLLAPLFAAAAVRARPDLDAADPEGSAAQYRHYLRGVLILLFATAALGNLSSSVLALQVWELVAPGPGPTVALVAPLVVAGIAWLVFSVRVGEAGHRLGPVRSSSRFMQRSRFVQRDDDRHWYLGGMIYASRSDPSLLVHRRVGAGWTLNLAHPVAWAVLGCFAVLAVLSLTGMIDLPSRG
jgi:uncharacterized membrane protein